MNFQLAHHVTSSYFWMDCWAMEIKGKNRLWLLARRFFLLTVYLGNAWDYSWAEKTLYRPILESVTSGGSVMEWTTDGGPFSHIQVPLYKREREVLTFENIRTQLDCHNSSRSSSVFIWIIIYYIAVVTKIRDLKRHRSESGLGRDIPQ